MALIAHKRPDLRIVLKQAMDSARLITSRLPRTAGRKARRRAQMHDNALTVLYSRNFVENCRLAYAWAARDDADLVG